MIQKLVLLPGMDGTGELFADFVNALPDEFEAEIVRYPADVILSDSELMSLVNSASPSSESFVLVAESFSAPLAIQYVATNPRNLKGLVLCAGFAASPVRGLRRFLCSLMSPILLSLPLPELIIKFLLVGPNANPPLVSAVREAVACVLPKVLLARLRAVFQSDARAELSQATVPILYLRAKQDRLVPKSSLDEILRIKPQISVVEINGPHLILQREPIQTADVVARFVQQIH